MLIKDNKDLIYLNVAYGFITRTVKKEDGSKVKDEYKAVAGLITSVDTRERPDFSDPKKIVKDIMIGINDGSTNYMLVCQLYRPFADGLIFSLANNVDFDRRIEINAYASSKGNQPKPSTLCSVKYQDTKSKIYWIEDIPKILETVVDGETIRTRKERNAFIDKCIDVISESVDIANKKREEDLNQYDNESYEPVDEAPVSLNEEDDRL